VPDQIWLFLERYKELIINGLDLLSFLLVTPQLTRVVVPIFRWATVGILFSVGVGVYSVTMVAVGELSKKYFPNYALFLILIFGVPIFVAWLAFLSRIEHMEERFTRLTSSAFWSGVLMFLLSRVVAFSIAMHGALSS
jgi:hypothetical protein